MTNRRTTQGDLMRQAGKCGSDTGKRIKPERVLERKYKWPCLLNPGNICAPSKLGMFKKEFRAGPEF